jgi:molybdate transport system substrate-binding protein
MRPSRRTLLLGLAALSASGSAALLAAPEAERPPRLLVFAPASLADAFKAAAAVWRARGGGEVVAAYAGSGAVARQVAAGAPADLVISANPDWMDWLDEGGLIEPESRVDLLSNRLALVAGPGASPAHGPARLGPGFDLAARLGGGRLAMALTEAAPAGMYGRAALQSLGLWGQAAAHVVEAENVRVALALVARGEAPLGVVYETDARADPRVRVLARFPERSHPPIVYPAALTRGAAPEARALLAFLSGREAGAVFTAHGFAPLGPTRLAEATPAR